MTTPEERVSSIEGTYDHLATKADVQELRGGMNVAMERLRADLRTEMEKLRVDMIAEMEKLRADLISEIHASEARKIKWIAGIMIGNMVANIAAIAALLHLFL